MPKRARQLPERCVELLGKAELIVHAGDISTTAALAQLMGLARIEHDRVEFEHVTLS